MVHSVKGREEFKQLGIPHQKSRAEKTGCIPEVRLLVGVLYFYTV